MATLTGQSGVTPRPVKQATAGNYLDITAANFWDQQYLPEVLEQEIERYGKRTVSGFLRMVGAEMPMASDRVVWSEQGRLHAAFTVNIDVSETANAITVASQAEKDIIPVGATVVITHGGKEIKARISAKHATEATLTISADPYGADDFTGLSSTDITGAKMFIFGSEFKKGSSGVGLAVQPKVTTFSNKPIILRDKFAVDGSDVAQIGWIEVTSENGASGYLWYMKAESEARLRFEDQLEMAMIEAENNVQSDGTFDGRAYDQGYHGMEGLFQAINERGIVYSGTDFDGAAGLTEFDDLLAELDKQGSIEENMLFLDRAKSLEIDNMLAAQNSYGAGGTSYGVFDNSEDMALNLGFSGFRRGSYDFYKTDWKYLNDSTTRGFVGGVDGVLVPAGTSSVYDETLGQNISRPFLHIRYRANQSEDRRMKSWITGSVGGNYTSDEDVMNVHFLSERTMCVQAANNFVLLK